MEKENVNNLNGVPNFGHGLLEGEEVEAEVTETETMEEVESADNVETPQETTSETQE